MRAVFADSYFFLALVNARDEAHQKAVQACRQPDQVIVTTGWVITEVADGLARVSNRSTVIEFLNALKNDPEVEVILPSRELFEMGLELYSKFGDKGWTLTDCISFIAMKEEGITDALTGDPHFEQAGFNILLK
jgi:predicted nucleic acid-binding protein